MKTIHLICNAHLDPVWLWRWEEGCAEALATFRTAADLLDAYPNLTFNHNELILYRWVEKYDPALFSRIRDFVKAGRWHIMGGWYLQPDCNMPAGESFVRNILAGRKYFAEKFGVRPTTAINFDSFGHSRGLVQLFKQAGYDSYIVCRAADYGHTHKGQDFRWKGLDGSEILVHFSRENYNSIWGHAAAELEAFLRKVSDEPATLFLWGVGDHGGGPSREDLDKIQEMAEKHKETLHLVHSTPEAYFAGLDTAGLPVYDKGLNPVADGCYTSQIRIKQKHRELENKLYMGERMAAAAAQLGAPYPAAAFKEAEEDLLFSEFHDALPGSGTNLVEEDTLRLLDHGLEILSREQLSAFFALTAGQEPIADGTSCFFLYNPHPYDLEGVFSCEVGLPKQNWEKTFLYPEAYIDGQPVPTQCEKEVNNFGIDWRKMVTIRTRLAVSSMTRVDVRWKPLEARPVFAPIDGEPYYLFDNGHMQVKINTATGLVDSYKINGVEQVRPGSFCFAAYEDGSNSWGIGSRRKGRRQFQLLSPHAGSAFSGLTDRVIPSVRVIEDGEVRTVVEAVFGLQDSKICQRYLLPKVGTEFEIETYVYWGEKEQFLRMECGLASGKPLGQIVFGREALADDGREFVFRNWTAVEGETQALAIINDGIHGGCYREADGAGLLGLPLLRSAGYAAAGGPAGRPYACDRFAPRMDQGQRVYRFKVAAGEKAGLLHRIDSLAAAFNQPPYAMAYSPSGAGEKPQPGLSMDNPGIQLSAFKQAEDKDGWILRLYEGEGKAQNTSLRIPSMNLSETLSFAPFQIRTFRIKDGVLQEEDVLEGF